MSKGRDSAHKTSQSCESVNLSLFCEIRASEASYVANSKSAVMKPRPLSLYFIAKALSLQVLLLLPSSLFSLHETNWIRRLKLHTHGEGKPDYLLQLWFLPIKATVIGRQTMTLKTFA
uniref:Uncharacterized protein n=1 Tax=Tanacetum cinerariifolium TaxID=118510 RepID=A0A6L2NW06_TANCI|nr:hypothetical protein [Tanacetum cinerariifolium]